MMSLTKNSSPDQKNFFECKLEVLLSFLTLEQLSTAFGTRVTLAQSHIRSAFFGVKSLNITGCERVNQTC